MHPELTQREKTTVKAELGIGDRKVLRLARLFAKSDEVVHAMGIGKHSVLCDHLADATVGVERDLDSLLAVRPAARQPNAGRDQVEVEGSPPQVEEHSGDALG